MKWCWRPTKRLTPRVISMAQEKNVEEIEAFFRSATTSIGDLANAEEGSESHA